MKLLDILDRDGVVSDLRGRDKHAVLAELATRAATQIGGKVTPEDLKGRLLEREKERGSTGIGSGVAVPHARAKEVDRLVAVFGRSAEGIEFGSVDNMPSHLFFALVSPDNQPGVHLTALARICKLVKSDGFRKKLMQAGDANAIFDALREEDGRV